MNDPLTSKPPAAPTPTSAERDALAAMPALGMFLLFFLGQVLVAPLLQLANVGFGLIFVGVFVLAAPPLLFVRAANLSPRAFLRLLPATPKQVGLGFAIGAANFLVAGMLQFLVRRVLPDNLVKQFDASHIFRDASGFELGLIFVAVGVSAPICEELAFRGYLQSAYRGRYRDVTAVLIAAILFSSLHLDPVGFFARIELGALFGLLALWSGSLLPAIAAHMANNLIASTLFLAAVSKGETAGDKASDPNFLYVLAGALLSAAATWFLLKTFRATTLAREAESPFIVPVDPEGDHRLRLGRAAKPLLLTALAACAALAVFVALDWRGIRISLMADTLLPHATIKQRLPDDVEEETFSRLRAARRRTRAGEVDFDRYLALRKELHGPDVKRGESPKPLTSAEIEAAFARFEGREPAPPAAIPAPDGEPEAVPEEVAPGLPPAAGTESPAP